MRTGTGSKRYGPLCGPTSAEGRGITRRSDPGPPPGAALPAVYTLFSAGAYRT
jgi:hypothetical protein